MSSILKRKVDENDTVVDKKELKVIFEKGMKTLEHKMDDLLLGKAF
jgi:hypothetical protein